jgi:NitT/TauT family transport system permease protein
MGEPRHRSIVAGRVALAVVAVAAWHATTSWGLTQYLAEPAEVLLHLSDIIASGTITAHLFATVQVIVLGFGLGFAVGVALPLVLSRWYRVKVAAEPYLTAAASVPKYALVPLLILWFGVDQAPRVCLVALLSFFPVCFAVLSGISEIDRRLIFTVRVLGAGGIATVWLVWWPSMLPFLLTGLKIAVPRAVGAAIVGELLVGDSGIGYMIRSAQQDLDSAGVLAGVIVATALVVLAAALLDRIERTALRWRRRRSVA